jgi:hypothetical protein
MYGDALKYYQLSLGVAKESNNLVGQGQVCFLYAIILHNRMHQSVCLYGDGFLFGFNVI